MEIIGKKLTHNILSRKPNSNALWWSMGTLVLCYFISILNWNFSQEGSDFLAASPHKVFIQKEYWRLFTSSFIHGDMAHFLSNSVMLSIMGYFVNYHYGTVIYPILGFIAGIFINLYVIWNFSPHSTLVGASGIVHYLWGFWFITYIFVQKDVSLSRRFMKVVAVGIFILAPTEFKENVSYLAHGVGTFLGILTGSLFCLLNQKKIKSLEVWEPIYDIYDVELAQEAEQASTDFSPSSTYH